MVNIMEQSPLSIDANTGNWGLIIPISGTSAATRPRDRYELWRHKLRSELFTVQGSNLIASGNFETGTFR